MNHLWPIVMLHFSCFSNRERNHWMKSSIINIIMSVCSCQGYHRISKWKCWSCTNAIHVYNSKSLSTSRIQTKWRALIGKLKNYILSISSEWSGALPLNIFCAAFYSRVTYTGMAALYRMTHEVIKIYVTVALHPYNSLCQGGRNRVILAHSEPPWKALILKCKEIHMQINDSFRI